MKRKLTRIFLIAIRFIGILLAISSVVIIPAIIVLFPEGCILTAVIVFTIIIVVNLLHDCAEDVDNQMKNKKYD